MANFTFTKIADTNNPYSFLDGFPSINNEGTVAFGTGQEVTGSLFTNAIGQSIFTGSGGPLTTIADISGPYSFFGGNSSINDGGTVSFFATKKVEGGSIFNGDAQGIFTGSGGSTTTISDSSDPFPFFARPTKANPSINDRGTVAFFATQVGFNNSSAGIFTGSSGPISTIADTSGLFSSFFDDPSINDGGTVAFSADLDAGGEGIFTGSGGPITTIADTSGLFSTLGSPSINNEGTVAFRGFLDTEEEGIFTGSGGPITTIADTSGLFSTFGSPSINNEGTVAFSASLDAGGEGIFTGPNPVTDKVIATGDPLLGSTVVRLAFFREGLNDPGQVAFAVRLADGTQGIYRADPISVPETSSALSSLVTVALGLIIMRKKRQ
jgi:hypothetical protein